MLRLMARLLPLIVLGTALCAVANMILTRNMNASEYGAFSFFLSTINLMALIGLLGFQQTLPRFLSLYQREQHRGLTLGFIVTALGLVILASVIITFVGIFAVVPWIRNTASHQCLTDGYYMATAVALISLFSVYLTYHRHALVSSGAGPDGAIYQFVLIGTVLVALVQPHSHPGLLAVEAVAAMGVAAAACLVVELVWCSLTARSLIGGVLPEFRLGEWLVESLPVGGSAALAALVYAADVIAVRLIAGSDKAALYAVASSLASFVWMPRTAVSSYFTQEAPHLPEAGRTARLQQLIGRALTFGLLAAATLAFVIAVFNQTLLGLYGQNYLAAWPVLFILLAARAIEAPASIGVKLLNLEGYGRTIAVTTVWTAAVFIGLLALLVTLLGEVGAALAVLLFGLLSNALFYRHALIDTGLRLLPQWRLSAA